MNSNTKSLKKGLPAFFLFLSFFVFLPATGISSPSLEFAQSLTERGFLSNEVVQHATEEFEDAFYGKLSNSDRNVHVEGLFDDYLEDYLLAETFRLMLFLDLALRQAEANYFLEELPTPLFYGFGFARRRHPILNELLNELEASERQRRQENGGETFREEYRYLLQAVLYFDSFYQTLIRKKEELEQIKKRLKGKNADLAIIEQELDQLKERRKEMEAHLPIYFRKPVKKYLEKRRKNGDPSYEKRAVQLATFQSISTQLGKEAWSISQTALNGDLQINQSTIEELLETFDPQEEPPEFDPDFVKAVHKAVAPSTWGSGSILDRIRAEVGRLELFGLELETGKQKLLHLPASHEFILKMGSHSTLIEALVETFPELSDARLRFLEKYHDKTTGIKGLVTTILGHEPTVWDLAILVLPTAVGWAGRIGGIVKNLPWLARVTSILPKIARVGYTARTAYFLGSIWKADHDRRQEAINTYYSTLLRPSGQTYGQIQAYESKLRTFLWLGVGTTALLYSSGALAMAPRIASRWGISSSGARITLNSDRIRHFATSTKKMGVDLFKVVLGVSIANNILDLYLGQYVRGFTIDATNDIRNLLLRTETTTAERLASIPYYDFFGVDKIRAVQDSITVQANALILLDIERKLDPTLEKSSQKAIAVHLENIGMVFYRFREILNEDRMEELLIARGIEYEFLGERSIRVTWREHEGRFTETSKDSRSNGHNTNGFH